MTSKERVIRCLEFTNPDRVPRDLWTLPYIKLFQKKELLTILKEFPLDFQMIISDEGNKSIRDTIKKGNYIDNWGR